MKTEDKFKIKNLVNRLQGVYPVGPILENGEPELGWKYCSATLADGTKIPTPIMLEAALVLDELSENLDRLQVRLSVYKVMANSNTGVYGKFGNVDPAKLEAEHDAAMYGDGFYRVEFVDGVRVSTRIDPANVELRMEDNKYIVKTPTKAKTSYSSIVDNIITWRKGCSCAPDNDPYQCKECTLALIEAIAIKAIRLDETEPKVLYAKATVADLKIPKLPIKFMGFTPKFYTHNAEGWAWVHESRPSFRPDAIEGWSFVRGGYEIGDTSAEPEYIPEICKPLGNYYCIEIIDPENIVDCPNSEAPKVI